MKIYTATIRHKDGHTYTATTASTKVITEAVKNSKEWNIEAIFEFELKTQGKNFNTWARPIKCLL